jgi:hypothetical protein
MRLQSTTYARTWPAAIDRGHHDQKLIVINVRECRELQSFAW